MPAVTLTEFVTYDIPLSAVQQFIRQHGFKPVRGAYWSREGDEDDDYLLVPLDEGDRLYHMLIADCVSVLANWLGLSMEDVLDGILGVERKPLRRKIRDHMDERYG